MTFLPKIRFRLYHLFILIVVSAFLVTVFLRFTNEFQESIDLSSEEGRALVSYLPDNSVKVTSISKKLFPRFEVFYISGTRRHENLVNDLKNMFNGDIQILAQESVKSDLQPFYFEASEAQHKLLRIVKSQDFQILFFRDRESLQKFSFMSVQIRFG